MLPFVLQPMCAKDHRNSTEEVSNLLSKFWTQRYQAYLHMMMMMHMEQTFCVFVFVFSNYSLKTSEGKLDKS